MVRCLNCGKEIPKEDYESFDGVCWKCWGSKEYQTFDYTLTLERRAFVLEKEGKIDKAKRIYWQIINQGFSGSFPYERLRVIFVKQEDWKGAIEACRAYIERAASYPGYNVESERMRQLIRKYEAKLGIGDKTHTSAEKILAWALDNDSPSARRRVQTPIPVFRPAREFPNWARGEIVFESIEVPEFQMYYPKPDFMNKCQLEFYKKWTEQWKKGKPVDVKGNITYLFLYVYDMIARAEVNPRDALYELRLLQHVYRDEQTFSEYLTNWVFDLYLLNSDYLNAIAYIELKRDPKKGKYANSRVLSLKYKLGLPISGNEIFCLSNRVPRKIVLDNLDIVFDYLEETVRDFEEKNNVNLLALITEIFAHHASSEARLFSGVPLNRHPRIELDYYDYSLLGDFNIVIDQWMRNAENALREEKGFPKIGEGWLTETILYSIVIKIFCELGYEVVHHSYPPFLGRQELDIHVPALNLGIEYMGRQHYEPIEFFGGQEGFEKRQALDERKKRLCRENNLTLVYFRYDEPIEENYIRSKLDEALSKTRSPK